MQSCIEQFLCSCHYREGRVKGGWAETLGRARRFLRSGEKCHLGLELGFILQRAMSLRTALVRGDSGMAQALPGPELCVSSVEDTT